MKLVLVGILYQVGILSPANVAICTEKIDGAGDFILPRKTGWISRKEPTSLAIRCWENAYTVTLVRTLEHGGGYSRLFKRKHLDFSDDRGAGPSSRVSEGDWGKPGLLAGDFFQNVGTQPKRRESQCLFKMVIRSL